MKKKTLTLLLLSTLLMLVLFPEEAFEGAADGLLLWFRTVLPTLLPYMILTNVLMAHVNGHKCRKHQACSALLGIVCGYPMGAKLCADMVRNRRISAPMGNFLLPVCNLAGPAFITSYVMTASLSVQEHRLVCLSCVYMPVVLYAVMSGVWLHFHASEHDAGEHCVKMNEHISAPSFDESITDSFAAITRLGGYIILFALFSNMLGTLLPNCNGLFFLCLAGLLEITNGISLVADSTLSHVNQILLSLIIVNFGGLSCICQTQSMLHGSGLSIRYYILSKGIIALLTGLMTYVLLC